MTMALIALVLSSAVNGLLIYAFLHIGRIARGLDKLESITRAREVRVTECLELNKTAVARLRAEAIKNFGALSSRVSENMAGDLIVQQDVGSLQKDMKSVAERLHDLERVVPATSRLFNILAGHDSLDNILPPQFKAPRMRIVEKTREPDPSPDAIDATPVQGEVAETADEQVGGTS